MIDLRLEYYRVIRNCRNLIAMLRLALGNLMFDGCSEEASLAEVLHPSSTLCCP